MGALRIKLLVHYFSILLHALHDAVGRNVIRTEDNCFGFSTQDAIKQLIKPRASTARMATILFSNVLDHLSFVPRRVLARCGQALCRKWTRFRITQSTPDLESATGGEGSDSLIEVEMRKFNRRDPLTLDG
jgi:hypothetical protein